MSDVKNAWLNVRLTPEEYETFQRVCKQEGSTVSKVIREYVVSTNRVLGTIGE